MPGISFIGPRIKLEQRQCRPEARLTIFTKFIVTYCFFKMIYYDFLRTSLASSSRAEPEHIQRDNALL
jgi:hypothetical protein